MAQTDILKLLLELVSGAWIIRHAGRNGAVLLSHSKHRQYPSHCCCLSENTLPRRWIDDFPPIPQPMRFGNKAFRQWCDPQSMIFSAHALCSVTHVTCRQACSTVRERRRPSGRSSKCDAETNQNGGLAMQTCREHPPRQGPDSTS